MKRFVLLGAGFSHNWGGWLASEAFEYLLGSPELDAATKLLLWTCKDRGGFEAALAKLEESCAGRAPSKQLLTLNGAIVQMFEDMDRGWSDATLHLSNTRDMSLARCFSRLDAVFTLNQDLFLERHYFQHVITEGAGRWQGVALPGVLDQGTSELKDYTVFAKTFTPPADFSAFQVSQNRQPCFKLHGSFNWRNEKDRNLVVLGGNKFGSISNSPILSWYHSQFKALLQDEQESRLLVIGYGFGDAHVNAAISEAIKKSNLRIFVVDPLGVEVLNRNRGAQITARESLVDDMMSGVWGASRRSVLSIFGNDKIEFGKLQRFLEF